MKTGKRMNTQEINIAIAEECGWKYNGLGPIGTLHHPTNCTCFDGAGCSIPNYNGDLNAMHEVEETLLTPEHQQVIWEYGQLLRSSTRWQWNATSAQRAEAFLKVKGKWKA